MPTRFSGRIAGPITLARFERTAFTTSQPYTYRNTLSLIRYIEEVRRWLDCLHDQVNTIAENANNLQDNTAKAIQIINDQLAQIAAKVNDISKVVDKFEDQAVIYNPTRGRYEKSKAAMRDMYRELAVFGARVDQMATLTTDNASKHSALEFAVVGNKTIFGNNDPRITPVSPREDES